MAKIGKNDQHQNWEKITIKHNSGSKIYPQNQGLDRLFIQAQVIIKYHSDMGHCFS